MGSACGEVKGLGGRAGRWTRAFPDTFPPLCCQRAVQELESLGGALERSQKGVETLESCRKETRSKADEARYLG